MTAGPSDIPTAGRRGTFARIVRSPWFAVGAGVVTLGLLVGAAVVYTQRFDPFAGQPERATYLPSAFPTTVLPSQVVGTRGAAITLDISAQAPGAVDSVQVWDGEQLYYELDDPQPEASGLVEFALDYVPLTAGVHVISTRTVTTAGTASFSDPFTLAVQSAIDDGAITALPADGSYPVMHIRSSPGDTIESIAARLGVATTALSAPFSFEDYAAVTTDLTLGSFDVGNHLPKLLDIGTVIEARAPSAADALKYRGFGLNDVTKYLDHVTATVDNCRVTVSTDNEGTFALYGSTPLHPGFVRVGDVSKDVPWVSDTMHLGTAVFRALPAESAVEGIDRSPTALASVTVPDSCLGNGWSGDLTVTNGVLITNQEISNAYAYVSVDRGTWTRFPADNGAFLPGARLNDVRSAVPFAGYDQLDVQVWSYQDGIASIAASGQYCHAKAAGVKSSAIGDENGCVPRVDPVDVPAITSADFTLTATQSPVGPIQPGAGTGSGLQSVFAGDLDQDPSVSAALRLTEDAPITLTTDLSTNAADTVRYQFSFFPISPDTVTLDAPGVFYTVESKVGPSPAAPPGSGAGRSTTVVHPWLWQGLKLDPEQGTTTFSANGNNLSIDDELAYSIATGNLASGKNLTDVVYVRAVAVDNHFADQPHAVIASRSIRFDFGDPATTYPILADPQVSITPGFDEVVSSGSCLSVVSYPIYVDRPEGSWEGNTNWLAGAIVPGVDLKGGDPLVWNNHYSLAHSKLPDPNTIYCLDPNRFDPPKGGDCGWGCALVAIAVGFAVGVVTGGIGGGIAAGLIVGAFVLGSSEISAELLELMKGLWDTIANAYNFIYQTVLTIAAELNPVCIGIKAVADNEKSPAATACESVTKAVVTAVVGAVTGLPPSLPTSTVLEDIAKGELSSLVEYGMDFALGEIGLSCATLTVEGPGVQDLANIAAEHMETGPASALNAAKTEDGTGLSACKAFAALAVGVVVSQITSIQQSQQQQIYATYFPPGLVTKPVADTTPTATVSAPAAPGTVIGATCPATLNATITLPWRVPGDVTADKLWTFTIKPVRGTIVAIGDPTDVTLTATGWRGDIPIPVLPNQYGYTNAYLYSRALATENAPLIHAFVDSPCLAATWEVSAQDRGDAWIADPRPVGLFR